MNIIDCDKTINLYMLNHQNGFIKACCRFITYLGSGIVWFSLYPIIYILGTTQMRVFVFSIIVAELAGLLLTIVIRNLVKRSRPRPYSDFLKFCPWNQYSFPSHHAFRSSLLATSWGIYFPQFSLFFIFAALFICFTRLYLQKHYWSDLAVGLIIGALCSSFVLYI